MRQKMFFQFSATVVFYFPSRFVLKDLLMLQQMFDFPLEKHFFPKNRRVDIDKKRKIIFILSFFVRFFLPTTEAYRTCWDLSKKAFFQNKKLKNFEKN